LHTSAIARVGSTFHETGVLELVGEAGGCRGGEDLEFRELADADRSASDHGC
jgi:hypothetical protein